jgi:hypothetical protein
VPVALGTTATDGLALPPEGPGVNGSQLDATRAATTMKTAASRIERGRRGRRGGVDGGTIGSVGESEGGPAGGPWGGVGIRIVGLSSAMSATVYGRSPQSSSRDPACRSGVAHTHRFTC